MPRWTSKKSYVLADNQIKRFVLLPLRRHKYSSRNEIAAIWNYLGKKYTMKEKWVFLTSKLMLWPDSISLGLLRTVDNRITLNSLPWNASTVPTCKNTKSVGNSWRMFFLFRRCFKSKTHFFLYSYQYVLSFLCWDCCLSEGLFWSYPPVKQMFFIWKINFYMYMVLTCGTHKVHTVCTGYVTNVLGAYMILVQTWYLDNYLELTWYVPVLTWIVQVLSVHISISTYRVCTK